MSDNHEAILKVTVVFGRGKAKETMGERVLFRDWEEWLRGWRDFLTEEVIDEMGGAYKIEIQRVAKEE